MKKSIQLIALVAVALLGSCSGGEKDKATAEKVDEKQRVKLASVTARPVDQIQEYTATVQAEVKNNIAPSSPVRIDQIFVEVGDRVSKGQKLVQMDAANLKQAKFRLDNQEIEFKRTDELYKVGGTSKSEWDAAKMALDVQKTTYKNLLENTALLSPINGVVTARNYDNGDMYSGGEPVLVVEQITPVKLMINVSEGYFAKVKKGSPVAVKVDGGRSVRVRRLIGNVDLGIDRKRQDLIRRVGVVAIVMNVCIALGHVRVFLYLLGVQSLYRQRRRGLFR